MNSKNILYQLFWTSQWQSWWFKI